MVATCLVLLLLEVESSISFDVVVVDVNSDNFPVNVVEKVVEDSLVAAAAEEE